MSRQDPSQWVPAVALAAVASAAALWLAFRPSSEAPADSPEGEVCPAAPGDGADGAPPAAGDASGSLPDAPDDSAEPGDEPGDGPEGQTAEEREEAERERRVEAFDALTDGWREPLAKGGRVSLEQIEAFRRQFKSLPDDRKDECLHRACNLIPDENLMVLAGLLFDKGVAQEYVELVFQDVLNRDEMYKKPVLHEIFKDKSHPCWTDVAWILDATGELPEAKGPQDD